MDDKVFKESLSLLKKGISPINFSAVSADADKSLCELRQFVEALTVCCYRLNQSNQLLRKLVDELKGEKNA